MSTERTQPPTTTKFIKNSLNASYFKKQNQVFTQKSQTVPDQSLTMRQLLDRYAKGLPLEAKEPVYYGEDTEIPNFKKMDLTEIDEYRKNLNEDITRLSKKERRKKTLDDKPKDYDNKENENGAE